MLHVLGGSLFDVFLPLCVCRSVREPGKADGRREHVSSSSPTSQDGSARAREDEKQREDLQATYVVSTAHNGCRKHGGENSNKRSLDVGVLGVNI